MLSHIETERTWAATLLAHATQPLNGEHGEYLPIGAKTMAFLNPLWKYWGHNHGLDLGARLEKGQDIRFFGDPHFGHANIIHMCERPFDAIETMDSILWENIVQAHEEADFVVCVGDWAMKNPISWQRKVIDLYPNKHVTVIGNHDIKGATYQQWALCGARASLAFSLPKELIRSWIETNESDMVELLEWKKVPSRIYVGVSHWPVPPQRLPGPAWINIHGHIHNRPRRPLRINCSVEAIDFIPRSISKMVTAEVIDELIRRQDGLGSMDESIEAVPGDAGYAGL